MSPDIPSFLKLKVITPTKVLVDDTVKEVSLPSLEGSLGILPGHRHLLVALGRGDITCRRAHGEERFAVNGGYARVLPDSVLVFTESSKDELSQPDEGQG